jgi:hypothetical protein
MRLDKPLATQSERRDMKLSMNQGDRFRTNIRRIAAMLMRNMT